MPSAQEGTAAPIVTSDSPSSHGSTETGLEHSFLMRIGAFGGPSGSADGTGFVTGGSVDIRAARYFGLDMYLFYGPKFSNAPASNHDQSGGFFDVKVQYPFTAGPVALSPRLGFGTGTWNAGWERFQGQFAFGGVELRRGAVELHADYYRGVGGTVTTSTITQAAGTPPAVGGAGQFEQARGGIIFNLTDEIRFGADYIHSSWSGITHDQLVFPLQLDF